MTRRITSALRPDDLRPLRRSVAGGLAAALVLASLAAPTFGQAPPEITVAPPQRRARAASVSIRNPNPYGGNSYSPIRGTSYVGPGGPAPLVAPRPVVPNGFAQSQPALATTPTGSVYSPRFIFSGAYGGGLGWNDGFTSFGGWIPMGINTETDVFYLDLRGYISYAGPSAGGGGNFVAGYRHFVPEYERFYGIFAGYDIDNGNANYQGFQQVVVGGESIGRYLSYRVNGYIPVGSTSASVFQGAVGTPYFSGHHILFTDRIQTRYQYGGVDGEVGGPLPLIGKYGLNGYVGGYYIGSQVDDTIGFKGRLKANINDDLQVGVRLTNDDIFNTNVWFTMTLRTPRGSWWNFFHKDWFRQPSVATKMDRSPVRRYRIATDLKTKDTDVLAIRPTTGKPYLVLHVNPRGNGGNGTYKNPVLAIRGNNARRFDIIYVKPGVFAKNGPITLFDNQRLLSTAIHHQFRTQRGTLVLPGYTGGARPMLRNTSASAAAVVQLANFNEVSGFRISGVGPLGNSLHAGIVGNDITGFNINHNGFSNTLGGVMITHVGIGQGILASNVYSGPGAGFGAAPGFSVTTLGKSQLQLDIERNTIDDAAGSGIFLHAANNSTMSAKVVNNTITDTDDDATALTPDQIGDGMLVKVTDSAVFHDSLIDKNKFTDNDTNGAAGLKFRVQGLATLDNVLIGNVDGNNDNGNIFTRNNDGFALVRTGNAVVNKMRFIDNASFANVDDGIDLRVGGGLLDHVDLLVANSRLVNNDSDNFAGGSGLFARIASDGILNLTLRNNLLTGNGADGIEIVQNRFTIDNGGVTGLWTSNRFARNGDNGIDISAPMLGLQVGTTDAGNVITRNAGAGIMLEGPGTATFRNNLITFNGAGLGDVTLGAGIDIQGVGVKNLNFVNNRILNNVGDGVEIAVGSNNIGQNFTLAFTDNNVSRNAGRGYDVLNKGTSFLDLTIRGTALGRSVISENGREGIYVVNTAAFSQTQQGPTPVVSDPSSDASHGMQRDGNYQLGSKMLLTVTGNRIVGNGTDQTSTVGLDTDAAGGSGLVIRVGTGGGGYGFTSPGGYAANRYAGVTANVSNNLLSGNFGADVYTESFTSTVDPPDTDGTWDEDEFTVNSYRGDPLARFDLTFVNNTFEETSFNNVGAFYNNGEDEFKSRVYNTDTNGTAPNVNGPFRTGSRRRNAQRLAFRGTPPNQLPPASSSSFLYPGMGTSTFRISSSTYSGTNTQINSNGTTSTVGSFALFDTDNQPYNNSPFDASGVYLNNARFGELPYGWSVAP